MNNSKLPSTELDIKQESYFPFNFKLFGGLLILGCFLIFIAEVALIAKILLIPIFFVLGLIVITARYGLKINLDESTYSIYVWILGLKFGKPVSFGCIRDFYINQVTEKAVATARSGLTSEVSNQTYKLFMRLDDGEKIHVDTDKDEQALQTRLVEYQRTLKDLICER